MQRLLILLAGISLLAGCLNRPEPPADRRGPSAQSLHIQRQCRRRLIDLPAATTPVQAARAYGQCLRDLREPQR